MDELVINVTITVLILIEVILDLSPYSGRTRLSGFSSSGAITRTEITVITDWNSLLRDRGGGRVIIILFLKVAVDYQEY